MVYGVWWMVYGVWCMVDRVWWTVDGGWCSLWCSTDLRPVHLGHCELLTLVDPAGVAARLPVYLPHISGIFKLNT